MKKALILMGLPASGKTTFAKEYENSKIVHNGWRGSKNSVKHIEIDSYRNYNHKKDLKDIIQDGLWNYSKEEYIIDGLFLTNIDIIKVINILDYHNIDSFEIHYWNANKERCLRNDKYRRNLDSNITIENSVLEELNIELIKTETNISNITAQYHDIKDKPIYKIFADKYDLYLKDDLYLTSDSWCLGGSYQNCWGTGGSVSADPQPTSFEQLDNLLEKVSPNISFLQYKKINNSCVDIYTYGESDYYGGSTENAYFRCDMENLVNTLNEMGLIDENEL